ncbi:MAG TPA: 6-bladed beta-propeller [Gemmatimonadaceae bacterium]|nr:6-bladed beta-propeller [Gemmatimonadaceae bacterium]
MATFAVLAPALLHGQGSAARTVPDGVSCEACSIAVRPLVRLGAADGDGSLSGIPTAVRADGGGRYWVLEWRRRPMLFDATGRFTRNVGRMGQGPGEFVTPFDVIQLPGDSLLVIDAAAHRATVFSADLRARRFVSLRTQLFSTMVVRWPDEVAANARPGRTAGSVLHFISFAGSDAATVKTFGPESEASRVGAMPSHRLAATGTARIWASEVHEYRLVEWTAGGERGATLERDPDWFRGRVSGGLGTPTSPPPPAIQAIHADGDGRLWVFVAVAAPTWREAWPGSASARGEVRAQDMAFEKLYRTTIELIDPVAARVVARRTIDQWVIAALPGHRIAAYTVDRDGIPRVEISRIELTGEETRRK